MRVFGAVMMIAGMVWMMVGCSGALAPLIGGAVNGGAASGLLLTDTVTQSRFNLSVADGVLTVSGMSGTAAGGTAAGGTAAGGTELLDGVTGASYSLGLTGGALTLAAGASSGPGAAQVRLADTVTAKTYELAVVSGALTLTAKEGQ